MILERGRKASKTAAEIEETAEIISIADDIANGNATEEKLKTFTDIVKPNGPMIYAFVTDKIDRAIKVGYTDQIVTNRIKQWKDMYGKNEGEVTCIGAWPCDDFDEAGNHVFFWDHEVHNKIKKRGYHNIGKDEFGKYLTDAGKKIINIHYSREFFTKYKMLLNGEVDPDDRVELSAELLGDIINQMHDNIKNGNPDGLKLYTFTEEGRGGRIDDIWGKPDRYNNTELQNNAIENAVAAIGHGKKKLLMAAVMRFGKTHATYEIIKQAGLKKVIITSGKADVRKAWRDDINHIDFYKDFVFVEYENNAYTLTYYEEDRKNNEDKSCGPGLITKHQTNIDTDDENSIELYAKAGKTVIVFATLHDLAGSFKDLKEKHKALFGTDFDMMVVDETHYGSHANTFGKVTKLNKNIEDDDDISDIEAEQEQAKQDAEDMKNIEIRYDKILQVSGTPYYILASNEMIDPDAEVISKVSYTDMLEARDNWNREHPNADKSSSPYFGVPTLHKVGLNLTKECRHIIKTSKDITDSLNVLFETNNGKLRYERAVTGLMKTLFGDGNEDTLAFLKNKAVDGSKTCKHTILVLPRINACHALKKVLEKLKINREIICIVGNNDNAADIADIQTLNNRLTELEKDRKKSIVLTVTKFLTGVSMPLIDSMVYLKNAKSPQEYDQAIFRLCTRYVKDVENPEGEVPKRVNMKENVYLIDFNIANMYQMLANSARMKAAAEGNPTPERIKELMTQDLSVVPVFCEETGKDLMGQMHEINPNDLMKVYAGYNSRKSISDIANDDIDNFMKLFENPAFQSIMASVNIDRDKSHNTVNGVNTAGTDTANLPGGKGDNGTDKGNGMHALGGKDGTAATGMRDKKAIGEAKEKFKTVIKTLLYFNCCIDEPYTAISDIIKDAEENNDVNDMLWDFGIDIYDIKKIYNSMSARYQEAVNATLLKISLLANDMEKTDYDKFKQGITGLGAIAKAEHVTPDELVEKMCDKLDDADYKNANSILLVNCKAGEFISYICKKHGKVVAQKCRIVPSSKMTLHLIRKSLKSLGLNDYINNILLPIKDEDGDGKLYDNFLDMNNKEILAYNSGKKFDVCLMNPPYDNETGAGNILDVKFVEKCNNISKINIVVYPGNRFISNTKISNSVQSSGHLYSVEFIDNNKIFNINTASKFGGIYIYKNTELFDNIEVTNLEGKADIISNTKESRKEYYLSLSIPNKIKKCVERLNDLYIELKTKYKTMVNDGHGFIYDENQIQRGKNLFNITKKNQQSLSRVKEYLKSGKYKYCLYKGSFNNSYDEVQEWLPTQDPDKLFKGQICWLTNKENVRDNIKYWLECPIADLWRRYYLSGTRGGYGAKFCNYGFIPALDFDQPTDAFIKYVDSLNDFTEDEIKTLKEFGIHNADKL